MAQIKMNTDLQVISTFNNSSQVEAYKSYKVHQTKQLAITNFAKTILKVATLISAISGAVVGVIQVFLNF